MNLQIIIIFIILSFIQSFSHGSFIDINHPIIISGASGSTIKKAYFGYSLTGIKGREVKIYIGAPNATTNSQEKKPGILWECLVNLKEPPSGQPFSENPRITCIPWNGWKKAPTTSSCCDVRVNSLCTGFTDEMWLGGTPPSILNNNSFVACSPRWKATISNTDQGVRGRCYIQFGNGSVETLQTPPERIAQQTFQWYHSQSGFSAATDNSREFLLVGTPGHLDWRGNAILYNLQQKQQRRYCQSQDQFNTVLSRRILNREDLESQDYFGYAISSGTVNGAPVFLAGAPRGHGTKLKQLTGQVSLISLHTTTSQVEVTGRIVGDQIGSYFGSVLAFVDLNKDGNDEIIVGAPFCTTERNQVSYDEGCVTIYAANSVFQEKLRPLTLQSGSRFGSAIANLGDIDQDGFNDVAIGAPGSADGQGEIFIYYGTRGFLHSDPRNIDPHRISPTPSMIPPNSQLRGFGGSLFGKVDVDGNGTPDILVGAWESDKVVIYRTRPKLIFKPEVRSHSISREIIYKLKRDETRFSFWFCIRTVRIPSGNTGPLEIRVTASFPADDARFLFEKNKRPNITFPVTIPENEVKLCDEIPVTKILINDIQNADIVVEFHTLYRNTIQEEDTETWTYEVGKSLLRNKRFCPSCPSTAEYRFKYSLPVAADDCDDDGNLECNTNLKITPTLIPISDIPGVSHEIVLGPSSSHRTINLRIGNEAETAYSPTVELRLQFSNAVYSGAVKVSLSNDWKKRCSENVNVTGKERFQTIVCQEPLHRDKRIDLNFDITVDPLPAMPTLDTAELLFSVYPNPSPTQRTTSDPIRFTFVTDVQLRLTSINKENTGQRDSYEVFRNSYEIRNLGLTPLRDMQIKFKIPTTFVHSNGMLEKAIIAYRPNPSNKLSCTIAGSEELLPLPTISSTTTESNEPSDNGDSNATLSKDVDNRRRKRRDTSSTTMSPPSPQTSENHESKAGTSSFYVDCRNSARWKCTEVLCHLQSWAELDSKTSLFVDLNLAFTPNASEFLIPPDATVYVTTSALVWSFKEKDALDAISLTILQPRPDSSLPAWLIFGSGIGGLIVFLLITLCLFKCGFFRRKTKEQLDNLKAQAEQEEYFAHNFPPPQEDDHEAINDDDES